MQEAISVSNLPMNQFRNVTPVQHAVSQQTVRFSAGELVVPASHIHTGLKVGEIFTSYIPALDIITKNTHRLIDVVSKLQLLTSKPLENYSSNLKTAGELFDSILFIVMLPLFFSPQNNGKYFLFDKENSCYRKADRLFLAGHLVCKSAHTLNKWRLIELGQIAKLKIGQYLSAFSAFTDGLMVGSCIFHMLDASKKLQQIVRMRVVNQYNIKKWQKRPHLLKLVKEGNEKVIKDLKRRWEWKIIGKQAELEKKKQDFFAHPARWTKWKIRHLIASIKKVEMRLTYIASGNYGLLFQEMSRIDPAVKLDRCRIRQARFVHDLRINWLKIAACITRIAVIAMALTFAALNFTAVIPVIAVLALEIISDSFVLAKIAMDIIAWQR